MDFEYILNTIKVLMEQRKDKVPNGAPYKELLDVVHEDLKMLLNELVSEDKLKFNIDINKQPIFYINE